MNEEPGKSDAQPSDITRLARDVPADSEATVISTVPIPPRPANGPKPEAVTPLALPMGFRLFEYRIDKVLGQGGFGITYLASDVNLNSKVAIKEYLPEQFACRTEDISVAPRTVTDGDFFERGLESYLVEARTLATFRHPNIVKVARFFEAHNTAYMVLEYERGESLKKWWNAHAHMPEEELLSLLAPLLDGLEVVHEAGFLHRDIKPDNIYVRDDDGSLVLLDFGAARQVAKKRTDEDSFVTPGYGPIEQYVLGDQGPWTDLYAFAATLYWMVCGRRPMPAPDRMVPQDPLTPASECAKDRYSPQFLAAIDWALQPETEDRPRDVAAFRKMLFAAHPSSMNLQEALHTGEGAGRIGKALMHPGSWPLAVKMTIMLVLTALTPMLITAYYNYSGTVKRVSAAELRGLEQLAGSVSGRLSQLLRDSSGLALFLGKDPEFVTLLQKPTEERSRLALAKLKEVVSANPDMQVATVLNADGKAVVSSFPGVAGGNYGYRQYFLDAMRGRPYVTSMIVGAVAGEPGVFFSNPVRDAAGKVIGVVTLRIKGSAISSILEASREETERTAMLIDGDGIIVHHTDPKQLYKSLVPLAADKAGEIVYDQRFRREKIETVNIPELAAAATGAKARGHVSFRSTISGQDEIAGFAPVQGQEWTVAITESRELFEKPVRTLFMNVLYSVVVVGLVFLGLAVWFARKIVRPIESLTAAAHALKSADYEKANVPVTSNDEIGRFARVFNVMIDVLRQRERELARSQKQRR
ncbi:hypothetical protein BWI17_19440 [Betaproteobacteria bacterium GR16-43]|nr:hypothetical protein BWI17_19440 [Betaproteobacteria bacterium GR16-43]